MDIVVELVIGAEEQLASHGHPQAEEDLDAGGDPHLHLQHLVPVGLRVEGDAVREAVLLGHIDEEGGEHHVGEEGDKVGQLPVRGDPLDEAAGDQEPGQGQTANHLPLRRSVVLPGVVHPNGAQSEDVSLEIFLSGGHTVHNLGQWNTRIIIAEAVGIVVWPGQVAVLLTVVRYGGAGKVPEGLRLAAGVVLGLGVAVTAAAVGIAADPRQLRAKS